MKHIENSYDWRADKEFQERICDIRNKIEELAEYAHEKWIECNDLMSEHEWDEIENFLLDTGGGLSDYETTEE